MKIFFAFAIVLFSRSIDAQSFRKYPVSTSGCSVYNFCEAKYDMDFSDDSSQVFTGECVVADVTYGIICVKLRNAVTDLDAAENLVIDYADYLKASFNITKSMGYGKGHRLNKNEQTRGIMDYWEDKELDNWKIKAWTDGQYIGFMYAYSKKELPETKVNLFLDSFRLPGM